MLDGLVTLTRQTPSGFWSVRTDIAKAPDVEIALPSCQPLGVYRMLGGQRELCKWGFLSRAHHPAISLPAVLFHISDFLSIF